jgi:hypothetical protein
VGPSERDRLGVWFRNVKEELAAPDRRRERSENALGAGAIVGDERADLESPCGRGGSRPRRGAGRHGQAHGPHGRGVDSGAQELRARRRKYARIVGLDRVKWDVGERNRIGRSRSG